MTLGCDNSPETPISQDQEHLEIVQMTHISVSCVKASVMPLRGICHQSVHKVQARFSPLPVLSGSCFDSQDYQI